MQIAHGVMDARSLARSKEAHEPGVGGGRDAELAGGVPDREPTADHTSQPLRVDVDGRSAEPFAVSPRPPESRPDALSDRAPLELRDCGHDREHRLTERRAGVDLLTEADELNGEVPEEVSVSTRCTERSNAGTTITSNRRRAV